MKNFSYLSLALTLAMTLSSVFADEATKFNPLTEITLADGRVVVADKNGRVAYTFDADDVEVSNCYDSCAVAWPPILVKSAEGIIAPMGVTARKDGKLQVTLDSAPLYYFVGDKAPGDIKGEGIGGVWHLIVD